MPNRTVYIPTDLDEALKGSDINVSAICQEALRRELIAGGGYSLPVLLEQSISNIQAALDMLSE